MIVQEQFYIGDVLYVRTSSDNGVKVHGGFPESDYDEVVDPASAGRTYTETDIPVDEDDPDATEILDILMGVNE